MKTLLPKTSWFILVILFVMPLNTASAKEPTSSDLQRWLDPHNRADIDKFETFMQTNSSRSIGGYDDVDLWDLDHSISFEGMPVKFVGTGYVLGPYAFLTLMANETDQVEALANRYFCKVWDDHITLDWASHETGKLHVLFMCGANSGRDVSYAECLSFISDPQYEDGSHNALAGCEDLIFDFTTYTDKDVCLGFTERKDFRDEERKRGLDCDAWFAAYEP